MRTVERPDALRRDMSRTGRCRRPAGGGGEQRDGDSEKESRPVCPPRAAQPPTSGEAGVGGRVGGERVLGSWCAGFRDRPAPPLEYVTETTAAASRPPAVRVVDGGVAERSAQPTPDSSTDPLAVVRTRGHEAASKTCPGRSRGPPFAPRGQGH